MLSWIRGARRRSPLSIVVKFLSNVVSFIDLYVIPTYFLTLPNSVWEKMFGIILLCDIYMLDSLRVCRRSSHGLSLALSCFLVSRPAMPIVHVTVHPRGLHPAEAARAWHLHVEEGMSIRDVRGGYQPARRNTLVQSSVASFEPPIEPGVKRVFIVSLSLV